MSTRKDVLLIKKFGLPASAGTVQSAVFDLGELKTPNDTRNEHYQFEVLIPALAATQLPTGTKLAVIVESSDKADFTGKVETFALGELTGANGLTKFSTKLSEKAKQYWRAKITATGAIGDLSAVIAEFAIVF